MVEFWLEEKVEDVLKTEEGKAKLEERKKLISEILKISEEKGNFQPLVEDIEIGRETYKRLQYMARRGIEIGKYENFPLTMNGGYEEIVVRLEMGSDSLVKEALDRPLQGGFVAAIIKKTDEGKANLKLFYPPESHTYYINSPPILYINSQEVQMWITAEIMKCLTLIEGNTDVTRKLLLGKKLENISKEEIEYHKQVERDSTTAKEIFDYRFLDDIQEAK